jgi:hypothetical protein
VAAVVVMLVGIGFIAILTGSIAERFVKYSVEEVGREVDEIEMEEEQLLGEVRDISARLQSLEQALARRISQPPSPPP